MQAFLYAIPEHMMNRNNIYYWGFLFFFFLIYILKMGSFVEIDCLVSSCFVKVVY